MAKVKNATWFSSMNFYKLYLIKTHAEVNFAKKLSFKVALSYLG